MSKKVFLLLITLLLVSMLCSFAKADTPITQCGNTITTRGNYYLEGNLDCSNTYAVKIMASDVTLDCKGKTIQMASGLDGIFVFSNTEIIKNVNIKNCKIKGGDNSIRFVGNIQDSKIINNQLFGTDGNRIKNGIFLDGYSLCKNHQIELNNIFYAADNGIIIHNCETNRIERNLINNTGVRGIYIWGSNITNIVYNSISRVQAGIVVNAKNSDVNIDTNYIQGSQYSFQAYHTDCSHIASSDNMCNGMVQCNNVGRFECAYSPYLEAGETCLVIKSGYPVCMIAPFNGQNFASGLSGTIFPKGNECILIGLSPNALNCIGQKETYGICRDNKFHSCEGCGGAKVIDCSYTNQICREVEGCVDKITITLENPADNTRSLPDNFATFKCSINKNQGLTLYGNWDGGWRPIFTSSTSPLIKAIQLPKGNFVWNCCYGDLCAEKNFTINLATTGCDVSAVSIDTSQCTGEGGTCKSQDDINVSFKINPKCITFNFQKNGKVQLNLVLKQSGDTQISPAPTIKLESVITEDIYRTFCPGLSCEIKTKLIFTDPVFIGKTLEAKTIQLYNSTSWLSGASGDFGEVNIWGPTTYACKITKASISPYCGPDYKCNISEKVQMNISVEDPSKCLDINNMSMVIRQVGDTLPDPYCSMTAEYSPSVITPQTGKNYYLGNWTIPEIPEVCQGAGVSATIASLYNGSQNLVGTIPSSSGLLTFWQPAPPLYTCKIIEASIFPYCGNDNICDTGEQIQMNITVEQISKCLNIKKMVLQRSQNSQGTLPGGTGLVVGGGSTSDCYPVLVNEQPQKKGDSILGNWTVFVSEDCAGEQVALDRASLHNLTGQIGLMSGDFGEFTFSDKATGSYNLTVRTCKSYTPANGSCQEYLNKGIKIDGESFVTIPLKTEIVTQGWHEISFDSSTTPVNPAKIFVNLPPNMTLTGVYTQSALTQNSTIIIEAVDTYGNPVGPRVLFFNDTEQIKSVYIREKDSRLFYNHTGSYRTNFTIEFKDITGFKSPGNASFNLTGKGIYILRYVYAVSGQSHSDCYCEDESNVITDCNQCYQNAPPFRYCENTSTWYPVNKTWSTRWDSSCSDYNCCFEPFSCNSIGTCERAGTTGDCNQEKTIGDCNTQGNFFCYWDKPDGLPGESPPATFCKHCTDTIQKPNSCSDYNEQTTCTADRCHVKSAGCPSGASCKCGWNTAESKCYLNASYTGSDPDDGICCNYAISFGTCGEGCTENGINYPNSKKKITTCTGPCTGQKCVTTTTPNDCELTGGVPSSSACVDCGIVTTKLPFFMPWQILIVLVLISAYYMLIISKRKNKKK